MERDIHIDIYNVVHEYLSRYKVYLIWTWNAMSLRNCKQHTQMFDLNFIHSFYRGKIWCRIVINFFFSLFLLLCYFFFVSSVPLYRSLKCSFSVFNKNGFGGNCFRLMKCGSKIWRNFFLFSFVHFWSFFYFELHFVFIESWYNSELNSFASYVSFDQEYSIKCNVHPFRIIQIVLCVCARVQLMSNRICVCSHWRRTNIDSNKNFCIKILY